MNNIEEITVDIAGGVGYKKGQVRQHQLDDLGIKNLESYLCLGMAGMDDLVIVNDEGRIVTIPVEWVDWVD